MIYAYDYADALKKAIWFYDANKCGSDVASGNVFSWRDACHTGDGDQAGLDLTGGYHDAGDHVKFGLPQAYMASMLEWALYEYRSTFDNNGLTNTILETIKYATDYFLRSHPDADTFYYQVGDGNTDHGYWGSPEYQTGAGEPSGFTRPQATAVTWHLSPAGRIFPGITASTITALNGRLTGIM